MKDDNISPTSKQTRDALDAIPSHTRPLAKWDFSQALADVIEQWFPTSELDELFAEDNKEIMASLETNKETAQKEIKQLLEDRQEHIEIFKTGRKLWITIRNKNRAIETIDKKLDILKIFTLRDGETAQHRMLTELNTAKQQKLQNERDEILHFCVACWGIGWALQSMTIMSIERVIDCSFTNYVI